MGEIQRKFNFFRQNSNLWVEDGGGGSSGQANNGCDFANGILFWPWP
jgi:hypothetical protein